MRLMLLLSASALALAGASFAVSRAGQPAPAGSPAKQAPAPPAAPATPVATPAWRRRPFFGELHLHTTMSLDAWTFGTKITPDQAYKFARGETVMVPAAQVAAEEGIRGGDIPAKRAWPLDFAAVTDHSEYLGAMHQLDDPGSAFSRSDTGRKLKAAGRKGFAIGEGFVYGGPSFEAQQLASAAAASDGWGAEIKAADDNYEPGKFTTFVAYEWTATPGLGVHMHRNVIFDAARAPLPFTAVQSSKPEDLWKYLDSVRAHGVDVLAIPHNSNFSDGRDFDWNTSDGRPIDEAYAEERAVNEPLVEIKQLKGASETTPELSPEDEFANFEVIDRVYPGEARVKQHGSYVREAWGRGLVIQSKVGANPFKMGVVGGSDIHNGLTTSDEDAFAGRSFGIDPHTMIPQGQAAQAVFASSGRKAETRSLQNSNPAITGVWAEENTRNSIFTALKRKETFATSGSRIRLRMFGGWAFSPKATRDPEWVRMAYERGVPMGGDLPARPADAGAPSFIVQAMKDPDGANLDRIQIIKVWLEGDTYREHVFDVALSGGRHDDAHGHARAVGNTVDLKTGRYVNSIGAPVLSAVWRDPSFDPAKPAVYYARVLEIPTPRWSTLLAIKTNRPLPAQAPATVQQRAWTSPIWFTPPRKSGANRLGG